MIRQSPNGTYLLRYDKRPWTLNSERAGGVGRYGRARLVREWRHAFKQMALEAGIPELEAIAVTAQPEVRNKVMPDTAACIGAVKAAIDGLVDAGVIADDGPLYVRRLTFFAPIVTGEDAVTVAFRAVAPAASTAPQGVLL